LGQKGKLELEDRSWQEYACSSIQYIQMRWLLTRKCLVHNCI